MRILILSFFICCFSFFTIQQSHACENASLVFKSCIGSVVVGPNDGSGPFQLCADFPLQRIFYSCSSGEPSAIDTICVHEQQTDGTYVEVYCELRDLFSFAPQAGKNYRFDIYHPNGGGAFPVFFETVDCLDIQAEQPTTACDDYFLAGTPIHIGLNLPPGIDGGCYQYSSEIDAHPFGQDLGLATTLEIDPCLYEKDTCFNLIVEMEIKSDMYDPACEDCPSFTRLECIKICTRPQTVMDTIIVDTTFCDGLAFFQTGHVPYADRTYWTTPEGCFEGNYVEGTTSGQYIAHHIDYFNCTMQVEIFNVTVDCCIDLDCISMPDEICEGQSVCVDVNCDFDFPIWYRWVVTELNGAWEDREVKAHIEPGTPLGNICISDYWNDFIPGKSYGISLDVCRTCWDGTEKCETKYLFFTYKEKTQYFATKTITCGETTNLNDWPVTFEQYFDLGCGNFLYWEDITNQVWLIGNEGEVSPTSNTTYRGVYECCEITYQINVENPKHEINICAEEGEEVYIDLPCDGFSYIVSSGPFPVAYPFNNPHLVTGAETFTIHTQMPNDCICETTVNIIVPERMNVFAYYCLDDPFFDLSTLIPPACQNDNYELIDVNSNEVLDDPIITIDDFIYGDMLCFRQYSYDANGCLSCIIDITIQAQDSPCENMPSEITYCDGSIGELYPLGQESTAHQAVLDLMPNPATNFFQIHIDADITIAQLFISKAGTGETKLLMDITGQRRKNYQMQVNCSDYRPGVYSVTVLLDNGELISRQIVIK